MTYYLQRVSRLSYRYVRQRDFRRVFVHDVVSRDCSGIVVFLFRLTSRFKAFVVVKELGLRRFVSLCSLRLLLCASIGRRVSGLLYPRDSWPYVAFPMVPYRDHFLSFGIKAEHLFSGGLRSKRRSKAPFHFICIFIPSTVFLVRDAVFHDRYGEWVSRPFFWDGVITAAVRGGVINQIKGRLLRYNGRFENKLDVFQSYLRQHRHSIVVRRSGPLLDLIVFRFSNAGGANKCPFLAGLFVLATHVTPFACGIYHPLVGHLCKGGFLRILRTFRLFLFKRLRDPAGNLLCLLDIVKIGRRYVHRLGDYAYRFARGRGAQVVVFQNCVFLNGRVRTVAG